MTLTSACWCGNRGLVPFSPGYLRCAACETLIAAEMPGPELSRVTDDEGQFYGREYWFSHQEKDLGHPNIVVRARSDLPERCIYWLRTLLKYRLPPARVIEMGSSHGGFVALLRWAGYDATGLEVSPWVVEFSSRAFDVPVLLGPVEAQHIEPASLDAIVLMDVLEHLTDPAPTIRRCLDLLRPDGILMIQTPRLPEGRTWEDLTARGDHFLEMMISNEHLYLFSQRSIREFLRRLGCEHLQFEPAIFAEYDMFLVASRAPLTTLAPETIEANLPARPLGRLVQALLDSADQLAELRRRSEATDSAHRAVIERQGAEIERHTAEIERRGAEMIRLTENVHRWHAESHRLRDERDRAERVLHAISRSRAYRVLRRFGRWRWIELPGQIPPTRATRGAGHLASAPPRPTSDPTLGAAFAAAHRAGIDAFNASQPNREMLDSIRLYSHFIIDQLDSIRPLAGCRLLDVGASPHGYALERALDRSASLYVGIGPDVATPYSVLGEAGSIGLLFNMDASALKFADGTFDAAISISALEHVPDVPAALSEIARVLKPGGIALVTFEPIWTCSYGHHLHHLAECAALLPPWAHLVWTPQQMRETLAPKWPESAPLSLDQAIEWIYTSSAINRLPLDTYLEILPTCPLEVKWVTDLREEGVDQAALRHASRVTGLSRKVLTTRGISVLLEKKA